MNERLLKLAVWKFASCDGCQLQVLDLGQALVSMLEQIEIAWFPEASGRFTPGPYDVSLVEGSISTPAEEELIRRIRQESTHLISIGACATAGGIQALRNAASLEAYKQAVYPHPDYIEALAECRPASHYVPVDLELRGCPINRGQLVEVLHALLCGRKPHLPQDPVCMQCKQRQLPCVLVEQGAPCLGPVTAMGCDALCPSFDRACYGCFGPAAGANLPAFHRLLADLGVDAASRSRLLATFNVAAFQSLEAPDEVPDD